jgi:predicted dehydrogenase
MNRDCLTVAVVGAGYWGKNLVRNFATAGRCRLKYVCDLDEQVLSRQKKSFPFIETTNNLDEVLADTEVQAVVAAVQAENHFEVAKKALDAGKHVYVEKPLTLVAEEAKNLIELSKDKGLKLMVGHLLVYHPAVTYVKDLMDAGQIGNPYYMYTQRVNLGIVRQNENAWWSLAPHDISVICHLFDAEPVSVAAQGKCFLQDGIEDVVFATIKFADGKAAHVHCSWLDPHKIRKMTVVGSEKMVTFDDMEATEKIRIYDKAAAVNPDANTYADIISLRFGDIVMPRIPTGEPLALECKHFIDSILDDTPILSDGLGGLKVVKILQAGQKSLESSGEPIDPKEF